MLNTKNQSNIEELGNYRFINEVGAGGLGKVFKALDETSGETVAIKVLHEKFWNQKKFLGLFHKELLTMSSLFHKNIVSYKDSSFEPPVCFIATEFIDGWSGYAFSKKLGRVPPLIALVIAIEILQGLDHLHLHDTIHADLSAANYLIDKKGRVLVTDFGLSCNLSVEDYKSFTVGTPGYYSPEHISNQGFLPATDLYCVGLIIYELIFGRKAVFASTNRHEVIENMKKIKFNDIAISDLQMKKAIINLLKKSLQFTVGKRFISADQMMFKVYEILAQSNIRFPNEAMRRFLTDKRWIEGPFIGTTQNIYKGYIA